MITISLNPLNQVYVFNDLANLIINFGLLVS